jgi:hypothetical protein
VIDPLEVEQQQDRLAHANVGEDRAAGVEHVIAARLRYSGRQRFFKHAALAQRGKIISGLPASGIELVAKVVKAALERLQM